MTDKKPRVPVFHVQDLNPAKTDGTEYKFDPKVKRSDLSEDQQEVYDAIINWATRTQIPYLTMGGYAGTGKTTVTAAVAGELAKKFDIAFCAFTGRAAGVLSRKLVENGLGNLPCQTIHSLIYKPDVNEKTGEIEGWALKEPMELGYDMFVVDEASMLAKDLWDDLKSYGRPILLVGDHGQLAPVGDNPNLMKRPDLRLEKIHRQAEGNPILALAEFVRNGGKPRYFQPTDDRVKFVHGFPTVAERMDMDSAAICFKNSTRCSINKVAREAKGFHGPIPDPSEIVMCLKNKAPIYNGMRGRLYWADYTPDRMDRIPVVVDFADENLRMWGRVCQFQFGREKTFSSLADIPNKPKSWGSAGQMFDFGYGMTCHKAQGSQFREVTVLVEKWLGKTEDDRRRWLYTAVTRASEQLNLVLA